MWMISVATFVKQRNSLNVRKCTNKYLETKIFPKKIINSKCSENYLKVK